MGLQKGNCLSNLSILNEKQITASLLCLEDEFIYHAK
jgi:hypothetical protein